MRIAIVAPPFYEIPPRAYGGTELVCGLLAEGLVRRGHDVTLVSCGGSRTSAQHLTTFSEPQPEGTESDTLIQTVHAARAAALLETAQLDLVHDHTLVGPLTAGLRNVPTLVTVHGAMGGPDSQADLFRSLSRWTSLVAISASQRQHAADLNWVATIHNGIDIDAYPFQGTKEDFVLFLGRMSPHKGVHLAVEAAAAAGRRLILAGSSSVPSERAYFQQLQPHLGSDVEWLGAVGTAEKMSLLSRAACVLFPACWQEPFGLVMVEALACGTPVVALRAGAVPEILVNRTTGIIKDDPSELAEAIAAAADLDPAACRADARRRFSAERMVEAYERLYRSMLGIV
jgi:glycosyltransferase involved in cell wall biosynthesis